MSEHLRSSEHAPRMNTAELERLATERLKRTEVGREHLGRKHEAVEAAREKLQQIEQVKPAAESAPKAEPAFKGVLTKAANYHHTLISLQHRMKPGARRFSRLIHQPTVERASEVIGTTVLRPSISLGATTTAVLLTGFMYYEARRHGYELRGSIMWLTLLAGAVIGLVLEGLYKGAKRLSR